MEFTNVTNDANDANNENNDFNNVDEFDNTILWANEEETTRKPVLNRIPSIYLIAVALLIIVLVLWLLVKYSKTSNSALSLIQNRNNFIPNLSDDEFELDDQLENDPENEENAQNEDNELDKPDNKAETEIDVDNKENENNINVQNLKDPMPKVNLP